MAEYLRIFTEDYAYKGEKEREDVHREGDWHEVFHCWVLEKRNEDWWIYLQQRSLKKKDYPGDFDITAAGHLEALETVEDGVRELQEELGISVSFRELEQLGVIPYQIHTPDINDAEFAHVFLYRHPGTLEDFSIQEEELEGIYATRLRDFLHLISHEKEQIPCVGYVQRDGKREKREIQLKVGDMGALPSTYLHELKKRMISTLPQGLI